MRKILFSVPAAVLALTAFTGDVSAQTATATASYEVQAINEVEFTGIPADMVISTGAQIRGNGVTAENTTWSVTTNETNKKVTGYIDTAMPTGTTLKVKLSAPTTSGTSQNEVILGTGALNAVDLVLGLGNVQDSGLAVLYRLEATADAAPTPGVQTKTVTYTITAGA